MSRYLLLLQIENQISPTVSAIVETVELGSFPSEKEARELLEEILEANDFEAEDEADDDA